MSAASRTSDWEELVELPVGRANGKSYVSSQEDERLEEIGEQLVAGATGKS